MTSQGDVDTQPHWSQRAVSWANLLLSLLVACGSVGAIVVANEARLTRLEERLLRETQINAMQDDRYYKTVTRRDEEYNKLRAEVNVKLDRIEADITAIKVAISSLRNR